MKIVDCIENYIRPEQIERFRTFIEQNQQFVLTTHVHPDGDALGSELTLFYALKKMGKQATILNCNDVPENYNFLNVNGIMNKYDKNKHQDIISTSDVCFILDIGEWARLQGVGDALKNQREQSGDNLKFVCIDHHPSKNRIGDFDIIYPRASSTGEILFLLLNELNISLDPSIAKALYTAILTDTGSFRFTNTTSHSHYMAAELIQAGVDHRGIYHQIYEKESLQKVKLLGEVLGKLNLDCHQRIVWGIVTQEMLKRYHLKHDEIEGLSEFPRRIRDVEISILFTEIDKSTTKVSLRSTGKVAINDIAQSIGGGGHPYASGALLRKPLKKAINDVLEKTCDFYQNNHTLSKS